jgi:membrane protein DedA with SNARE-associated domain
LKNNNISGQENKKQAKWWRVLAILLVISISISIFLIPDEVIEKIGILGYPGAFLISLLSSATVLLPAPGLLVVISLGSRMNPLLIAISGGLGAALGELSSYAAGYSAQTVVENNKIYQQMVKWMKKNGPATVLILAAIPNPFFDITGIAAGALKMNVKVYFFWALLGNIIKMLILTLAASGLISLPILQNFL